MLFAQDIPGIPLPDESFWTKILVDHGVSGVLVLGLLAILVLFLRWARPHADRIVEGHLKMVGVLADEVPRQRSAIEKLAESQADTARAHEVTAKAQEATALLLDKHLEESVRNHRVTEDGIKDVHRRIDTIIASNRTP